VDRVIGKVEAGVVRVEEKEVDVKDLLIEK